MEIRKFRWEDTNRWDQFCEQEDFAWFWHTSFRMKHALNCSFAIKSENHSFYVEHEGKILGIAPLTIDRYPDEPDRQPEMTYGGGLVPVPIVNGNLDKLRKEKLSKMIFTEIDRIALTHNVSYLIMKIPLTLTFCKNNFYYNFLPQYGFQDFNLNTAVIDLQKSESDLWNDLRSGHKQSIKKASKNLKTKIFGESNITQNDFHLFKDFYFKAAGKTTRPDITFELLYHYLTHDMAVMVQALQDDIPVGYAISIYYKNDAYYLMSANDFESSNNPITHLTVWETMRYLKQKGILHYETGLQHYDDLVFDQPSEKEKAISFFKRGFGGMIIPHFIGEKIYSEEYFRRVWHERLEGYCKMRFGEDCLT